MNKILLIMNLIFLATSSFADLTESPVSLPEGPYGTLILSGRPGTGQSGDFQIKRCATDESGTLIYFSCETSEVEATISLNESNTLSVDLEPGTYQLVMYGAVQSNGKQKLLHGNFTYIEIIKGQNTPIELRTKNINNRRGSFVDTTIYLNPNSSQNRQLIANYVGANGFFYDSYRELCPSSLAFGRQMKSEEFMVYRFCETYSRSAISSLFQWGMWIDDTLIGLKKGQVSLNVISWDWRLQSTLETIDFWIADWRNVKSVEREFVSVLPIPQMEGELLEAPRIGLSFQQEDGLQQGVTALTEQSVNN